MFKSQADADRILGTIIKKYDAAFAKGGVEEVMDILTNEMTACFGSLSVSITPDLAHTCISVAVKGWLDEMKTWIPKGDEHDRLQN